MYYRFPFAYKDANLDTGKFDAQFGPAISWLKNPDPHKNNLIIQGPCGTGKTYLIHAYLNSIIKTRNLTIREMHDNLGNLMYNYCEIPDVFFGTMKTVMGIIRDGWKSKDERQYCETVRDLQTIPIMIIDEIGVQYGSDSERIELHEIFDYRREWGKPTVAITNAKDDDVARIIGMRNFSRLYGGATIVHVNGRDKRNG